MNTKVLSPNAKGSNRASSYIDLVIGGSKRYHDSAQPVFCDLTISLERGKCLAVMGPNACGKSTFLRCLLGLTSLDDGLIPVQFTPSDFLGVVMQDYRSQLLGSSSVRANLLLPLGGARYSVTDPTRILSSAAETFARLGYDIALDDRIAKLSGGAQQAVVLARALAFSPEFFVWDEPTSAIDLSRRRSLYSLLESRWRKTPSTVLFVTHDMDEALMLSDRVLVFDTGMRLLLDLPIRRPAEMDGWTFLDSPQAQHLRRAVRHSMDSRSNRGAIPAPKRNRWIDLP